MVCEMKEVIKTARGTFHIHEQFVLRQEAEEAGYCFYFSENGCNIFIHHFDRKNIYRVHFALVRSCE